MSIKATIYEEVAAVEIHGGNLQEFNAELERFRNLISPADRTYDPEKKLWIVKNYKNYTHLDFIKWAIEDRAMQPMLFEVEK